MLLNLAHSIHAFSSCGFWEQAVKGESMLARFEEVKVGLETSLRRISVLVSQELASQVCANMNLATFTGLSKDLLARLKSVLSADLVITMSFSVSIVLRILKISPFMSFILFWSIIRNDRMCMVFTEAERCDISYST